jgi:prevent-host-death family protein
MAIDETVSAAEANRAFSRLLRGVREGRSYVVTAHGRPVAKIVPAAGGDERQGRLRAAALRNLVERVRKQPTCDIGRWTREELYEK